MDHEENWTQEENWPEIAEEIISEEDPSSRESYADDCEDWVSEGKHWDIVEDNYESLLSVEHNEGEFRSYMLDLLDNSGIETNYCNVNNILDSCEAIYIYMKENS